MKSKKIKIVVVSLVLIIAAITCYFIFANSKGNVKWVDITFDENVDLGIERKEVPKIIDKLEMQSFKVISISNNEGIIIIKSASSQWVKRVDNKNGVTRVTMFSKDNNNLSIGGKILYIKVHEIKGIVEIVNENGYKFKQY